MKLPLIRKIQQNASVEEIEATIKVLEAASESPSLKGEEIDVIGELISNCCGALEVHQMISEGMAEKDAANAFMKKVLGSIDK
ncbi:MULTISPECIES: DUF6952 family protein [unclassified Paraflavitalea]|uniref:DUF6952 family protein n=1 Tax=unclassified Paraflavitalea TaxID=2798305 RepID=UPI003D3514AA